MKFFSSLPGEHRLLHFATTGGEAFQDRLVAPTENKQELRPEQQQKLEEIEVRKNLLLNHLDEKIRQSTSTAARNRFQSMQNLFIHELNFIQNPKRPDDSETRMQDAEILIRTFEVNSGGVPLNQGERIEKSSYANNPEKKYRPSPKDSSPKYTNALNTMSTYDRWKAEGPSLRQRVIETEKRAKLLFEFARKHRDDLGHTPLQREAWKNLHARYLTNFNSIRDNRNYEPHQFMDIWEQKLQDINNLLDRFTIEGKGIKNSAILKSDDGGQIA